MLDQGKSHRVRPAPASLLPGDRNTRLCAMAAETRELLKPWASQETTARSISCSKRSEHMKAAAGYSASRRWTRPAPGS